MAASWVYVTGDSFPFKVLEPSDVLVDRVERDIWMAVPCESPINPDDEDAGSYTRTVFIRTAHVSAIGPIADPGG